jgi:adenylate cyclase
MSGAQAQDFFAEGIAEDVLNQLSRVSGVDVISRASSFRYRGPNAEIDQAGRKISDGRVTAD